MTNSKRQVGCYQGSKDVCGEWTTTLVLCAIGHANCKAVAKHLLPCSSGSPQLTVQTQEFKQAILVSLSHSTTNLGNGVALLAFHGTSKQLDVLSGVCHLSGASRCLYQKPDQQKTEVTAPDVTISSPWDVRSTLMHTCPAACCNGKVSLQQ